MTHEEAAEVVREIFNLALEGNGMVRIADILTERKVLTPGFYKAEQGDMRFLRYQDRGSPFGWCYQTVRKILKDLVYCSECGTRLGWMMKPVKTEKQPILRCVNHFHNPDECQHNHFVYYEDLYAEVLARIKALSGLIDSGRLLKQLERQRLKRAKKDKLASERTKIHKRLEALTKVIKRLYEDYANDMVSAKDYQLLLKEYNREQKKLNDRLTVIGTRLNGTQDEENVGKLKVVLDEYFDRNILTPTLLVKLIERIEVGHIEKNGVNREQEITIYYRFIGAAE